MTQGKIGSSVQSQCVIKSPNFVITVAFCNKKPDGFCNKLLLHFVIK